MIQKFTKIKSVGRFKNFSATGVGFKEFTAIYAENGSGKTTLSSIIRSLSLNDPSLIQERRSINSTENQTVQVIIEVQGYNKSFQFSEQLGWSNQANHPDIEIFDIFFVNENIYSGFTFSNEHGKNLHKFVIGKRSVELSKRITENKIERERLKYQLDQYKQDISAKIAPHSFSEASDLNWFLKLKETHLEKIDDRLEEANINYRNAQNDKSIKALSTFQLPPELTVNIDFNTLLTDLGQNLDSLQHQALTDIYQHHIGELKNHEIEDPESWVNYGFKYISAKKNQSLAHSEIGCPFCKQPLQSELDILKAYTLRFNTVYQDFIDKLKIHRNKIANINIGNYGNSWEYFKDTLVEKQNSWKIHIPKIALDIPDLDFDTLNSVLKNTQSIISEKIRDPNSLVSTAYISEFQQKIISYNQSIMRLKEQISGFNENINTFKKRLKDTIITEQELKRLQLTKLRFQPEIVEFCTQYSTSKSTITQLEKDYTTFANEEEQESVTFITRYGKKINNYLNNVFRTSFTLQEIKHGRRQGKSKEPKMEYELHFDGHPISFEDEGTLKAKHCLSEGDKNIIAFAFFLAKLDVDDNTNDRIIIFDDPLSSLDSNRRTYIVDEILKYLGQMKQIIVLTHNEVFLNQIYYKAPNDKKIAFEIKQNFSEKTSSIAQFEIDDFFKEPYIKNIEKLQTYLADPQIELKDDCLAKIRNVLEYTLQVRYHRHLSRSITTFGSIIDEINNQNIPFRNNENRDTILQRLRKLNTVSCPPHHGTPFPEYGSLGIQPENITPTELALFIEDTFDLIDRDL